MMETALAEDLFTVDAIVEQAGRLEPGAEGPFEYLDGLEVLCDSLEREADCTPQARAAISNGLALALATQHRIRRQMRAHPEIEALSVGRPVFIIGFPRSGTTLLHNVLAQHPDLHCPLLWELLNPAGFREEAEQQHAAHQAQRYVEAYYRGAPLMPLVHPMDAHRPDECQRLLGNAFRTPIFWIRHDVPSYAAWFLRQDLARAYEFHRTQLQNILWRVPGGVPVLKDPFHIWNLAPLARAYPTARFVFLHRDPAVSIISTCKLTEVARSGRSARKDPLGIGRFWLSQIERQLARVPAERRAAMNGRDTLDIRYEDLTRDTVATVARIADFIEVPFEADAVRRAHRFVAENPLQKQGVLTYSAAEFGLDEAEMRERFADYRRAYDL